MFSQHSTYLRQPFIYSTMPQPHTYARRYLLYLILLQGPLLDDLATARNSNAKTCKSTNNAPYINNPLQRKVDHRTA